MNQVFQPGDTVRIRGNANGLEMLVEGYDEAGKVICSLWEGVSRRLLAFPEEILERVPPAVSPP